MKVLKFSKKINRVCFWKQWLKNYKFNAIQSKILFITGLYLVCYVIAFTLHLILN